MDLPAGSSSPAHALLNECVNDSPSIGKASAPVSLLVASLVQQLCTLLEPNNERSRQLYDNVCESLEQMQMIDGTWNMGEFELMRQQYQNALYQLVRVSKGPDMILPNSAPDIWPLPQPVTMEWSRYHKEFEELSFIAGGGFGKVYRARNKLDGIVYAVKKVIIRAKSINKVMSHLSEVKTLASLHHVNIVPYKAAWLEPVMASTPGTPSDIDLGEHDDDDDESLESSLKSSEREAVSETKSRITRRVSRREEISDSVVFQNSNERSGDIVSQLWTKSTTTHVSCETEMSTEEVQSKAICPYESKPRAKDRHQLSSQQQLAELQPHLKLEWAVLYIQMTDCQLTLRTWLDNRNNAPDHIEFYRDFISANKPRRSSSTSMDETESLAHFDVVSDVFQQLINGLYYIHARHITHHDIKPSNIFISLDHDSNILVQLGDFGLACPLKKTHEKALGTPQYAAPEQLRGKCDQRSDIYSLGVILLELLLCFHTDMERNKTVADARRGQFPDEVPSQFRELLQRLLSHRVEDRPHSFELAEIFSRLCRSRDPVLEDLQKKLVTREQQIAELRGLMESNQQETVSLHRNLEQDLQARNEELSKKDEEILNLRKKLEQLETQDRKSRRHIQAKHQETKRLKKKLLVHQRGSSTDNSG